MLLIFRHKIAHNLLISHALLSEPPSPRLVPCGNSYICAMLHM
jgi:hypothetical protein